MKIFKTMLALIASLVAGGVVNMTIIMASGLVVSPPPGADLTTAEGIIAALPLLGPEHFIMPFLAHALGTLTAAFCAAWLTNKHCLIYAVTIGCVLLAGGIAASLQIPAPSWFVILDLTMAYLPMSYLGWWLAQWRPHQK